MHRIGGLWHIELHWLSSVMLHHLCLVWNWRWHGTSGNRHPVDVAQLRWRSAWCLWSPHLHIWRTRLHLHSRSDSSVNHTRCWRRHDWCSRCVLLRYWLRWHHGLCVGCSNREHRRWIGYIATGCGSRWVHARLHRRQHSWCTKTRCAIGR